MKMQSVKYLMNEGFKNVWVNRLMSVASVGVLVACMTLIGMAVLLTKNVDKSMSSLEQQNVIMAYFNDKNSVLYGDAAAIGTSSTASNASQAANSSVPDTAYRIHNEQEAQAVCDAIQKLPNVASVEYISSEKALENAKSTVLEDQAGAFEIFEEEGGNPMSAGCRITLTSMEQFDQTIAAIKNTEGVSNVVSHGDLAKKLSALKSGIAMVCFWIIGILGIISLVIVSNTIRVTMYNRKLEISIMKAVGATDSFIRLPFIIEGMVLGLISAGISEGLVYLCYRIAAETMSSAFTISIPFGQMAWQLLGIFAGIGVLAGAFGSAIMISKYLRKEGSEFKAL